MQFILKLIYKNKLFVKYCFVGGTAAIVDFSILFIMTSFLGVYYLYSATISFIFSALTNYTLNRKWTFRSSGQKRKQIPIFFSIAIFGLILNNGIMYIGVEKFDLWYMLAKVFATGFVLMWNFLGHKYFTFATPSVIPDSPSVIPAKAGIHNTADSLIPQKRSHRE